MRKINLLFVFILFCANTFAQSPEAFKYQAVLRNASGTVLVNTATSIDISILQGSITGTVVYTETHNAITNSFGIVNLEIGNGINPIGSFTTISWANDLFFVNIKVDGVNMGTSPLLSVPYALHAKTAESITGTITETDPIFIASPANGITITNGYF